jgi:hypothetical protein|tara:strand:+ start:1203 stop:1595 length:393 start_codon:yes stop_codon:yes gene_type:complete
MEGNNNKRKNDGRKYNKRQGRVKVIKEDGLIAKPKSNAAKRNRSKDLSAKAISNIFGSEDGIWDKLAEMAKEGNMKAMTELLSYQYGKAGERKDVVKPQSRTPIIQFVNNSEQPKTVDNTVDITHIDEEE